MNSEDTSNAQVSSIKMTNVGNQFGCRAHPSSSSRQVSSLYSLINMWLQTIGAQLNMNEPVIRKGLLDLDSHADTCCMGMTARIIEYTGQTCDVTPFSAEYMAMKDILIVKARTAYDDSKMGETYILVLAQLLYLGDKLENSLLCPNQLQAHGVVVDDVPLHLSTDEKVMHSLYFPEQHVCIPLQL